MNEHYKAAEKENRQPKGILGDVAITNGPYNEPGGAYMFYGTVSSYIEFPNRGGLDTRFSITLMCWVQPGGQDGPLFSYGKNGQGVQIRIVNSRFALILQRNDGEHVLGTVGDRVLPTGSWVHVAATYDNNTAQSSYFFNGHFSSTARVPTDYSILTNTDEARMGAIAELDHAYFKGKIAKMRIYDVALNEVQIQRLIIQGK